MTLSEAEAIAENAVAVKRALWNVEMPTPVAVVVFASLIAILEMCQRVDVTSDN